MPQDYAGQPIERADYEEWERRESQNTCKHENFMADVAVGRLQSVEGGPITRFSADVKIHCTDCGVRMKFVGLPMGLDLNGATVSVDGTEARLAIFPENEPHPSNLTDEPPGFRIMHHPEGL